MTGAEALLVVSVLATAASTGVAMYSASEQSKSQAAIADYNRQVNEQNAQIARNAAIAQAQAAQYNAQVEKNNADFRQQAADAQTKQSQEQANRIRQERDRILGLQRSQYAAGGVTPEGSPLAVLADTFTQGELAAVDEKQKAYEFSRQQSYLSNLERTAADYQMATALWEEKTAGAGYRINMRQADIEQQAGYATSRATALGGYSAAAAGVAQMGQTGMSAYGNSTSKNPTGSGTNPAGEYQYRTNTVPRAVR
jgi:hypothetical protein